MNRQHVEDAIAIMERVKAGGHPVQMEAWQTVKPGQTVGRTEEELHTCGTAACFAGWVAVSPEFQAAGGGVALDGAPRSSGTPAGAPSIARWLDIYYGDAQALCAISGTATVYGTDSFESLTVDDVLSALYRLRDTGSVLL